VVPSNARAPVVFQVALPAIDLQRFRDHAILWPQFGDVNHQYLLAECVLLKERSLRQILYKTSLLVAKCCLKYKSPVYHGIYKVLFAPFFMLKIFNVFYLGNKIISVLRGHQMMKLSEWTKSSLKRSF
jgi:hypothetical protein